MTYITSHRDTVTSCHDKRDTAPEQLAGPAPDGGVVEQADVGEPPHAVGHRHQGLAHGGALQCDQCTALLCDQNTSTFTEALMKSAARKERTKCVRV